MHRKTDEIEEAARHLDSLMSAMYEGRSVRNTQEFQADLRSMRVAIEVMNEFAAERKAKCTPSTS